jgi:hypothetical protein
MSSDIRGPVDLFVITFTGSQFTGGLVPAMKDLVEKGIVRIIDMAFIRKDTDGGVQWLSFDELDVDKLEALSTEEGRQAAAGTSTGLLNAEDFASAADELGAGDSALALLVENLWAADFAAAVVAANGRVTTHERVPPEFARRALG